MNCLAFVVAFHIISSVTSNFNFDPDGIFIHFSVPNTGCPRIKVLRKNFNNDLLITLLHVQFFNIDVFSESFVSFVWCIRLDKPVSVLRAFKLNTNYVIRFYKFFNIDLFSESVSFVWCIRSESLCQLWVFSNWIQIIPSDFTSFLTSIYSVNLLVLFDVSDQEACISFECFQTEYKLCHQILQVF